MAQTSTEVDYPVGAEREAREPGIISLGSSELDPLFNSGATYAQRTAADRMLLYLRREPNGASPKPGTDEAILVTRPDGTIVPVRKQSGQVVLTDAGGIVRKVLYRHTLNTRYEPVKDENDRSVAFRLADRLIRVITPPAGITQVRLAAGALRTLGKGDMLACAVNPRLPVMDHGARWVISAEELSTSFTRAPQLDGIELVPPTREAVAGLIRVGTPPGGAEESVPNIETALTFSRLERFRNWAGTLAVKLERLRAQASSFEFKPSRALRFAALLVAVLPGALIASDRPTANVDRQTQSEDSPPKPHDPLVLRPNDSTTLATPKTGNRHMPDPEAVVKPETTTPMEALELNYNMPTVWAMFAEAVGPNEAKKEILNRARALGAAGYNINYGGSDPTKDHVWKIVSLTSPDGKTYTKPQVIASLLAAAR